MLANQNSRQKAMANLSCSFASHCDSYCDISSRGNELLPLSSCSRDVSAHLQQISVSHQSVSSEKELSLARAGLFDESGRDFTICPKHWDKLGVKFNASIKCQHPLHGNRKGKRERGVSTCKCQRKSRVNGMLLSRLEQVKRFVS